MDGTPKGSGFPFVRLPDIILARAGSSPMPRLIPVCFSWVEMGGEVVAFSLQLGPGLCYGLNDKWSLDASINYDFATAAKAKAPSMGSAIKLGITYHFL